MLFRKSPEFRAESIILSVTCKKHISCKIQKIQLSHGTKVGFILQSHILCFFGSLRHRYLRLGKFFAFFIFRDENGDDTGSTQLENEILSFIGNEIDCKKSNIIQNAVLSVPTTPLDAREKVGLRKYSLDDPVFTPSVAYDYKPNYTEITALALSSSKPNEVL